MENFAVLDDSAFFDLEKQLYVYAHALIVVDGFEENFYTKIIEGGQYDIYDHENELKYFIEKNIFTDTLLYACAHYGRYKSIWKDLVYQKVNRKILKRGDKLPEQVNKKFREADSLARKVAKKRFKQRLEELVLKTDT